jgi:hypothetical protein
MNNLTVAQIDALIADRARYRSVVRQLVEYDGLEVGPSKDVALQALLNNAVNSLASESKP